MGVIRFLGLVSSVVALRCWEGSSTQSELPLGPPFAAGMHEVNCSGACHLVSEHCDEGVAAVTVARCVDSCPAKSACEICCHSDLCNSQEFLSSFRFDSPLTFFSLPINSRRIGVNGRSAAKGFCATLVIMEPEQDGCVSPEGSNIYVTLNPDPEDCGWAYRGNAQVAQALGCWKNLEGKTPEIAINISVISEIFTGSLHFSQAPPQQSAPSFAAVEVEKILTLGKALRSSQRFSIATGRSNDSASVAIQNKSLVVELDSPFGIGRATITKIKGAWPRNKIVLLNLRGLEKFQVSNGDITLHASVASGSIRLWADEAELELLPQNSRMSIVVVGDKGVEVSPPYRFPLPTGFRFQITLPPVLFSPGVSSLNLEWIDFYR